MLLRTATATLLLLFSIDRYVAASAIPSDVRLIALAPPESQIVAGMDGSSAQGHPRGVLLVTRDNGVDYQDFLAVTGGDTSRRIQEIVLLAAAGPSGRLSEHSLLASGHFDRDAIFKFAQGGKASAESYGGVPVLVVRPFAREQGTFNEVRWLAILDSNIAVFGTAASVQQEMDRYAAKSAPYAPFMERLRLLGPGDFAWCLLPAPGTDGPVQRVLERLDPKLGAVAREGASIQYGIRFGGRVEITASANVAPADVQGRNGEPPSESTGASYFLPRPNNAGSDGGERIVVKVPLRRYEEWLAAYSRGSILSGAQPSH
jgi:hypothetical protein